MFRGPEPVAPAPEEPFLERFIKSNEKTIESSFIAFNSNPGIFCLFCNNSL